MFSDEDGISMDRTSNWARVGQATSELQLLLFLLKCVAVGIDPICFWGHHNAVLTHIHFSTTVENAAKMTGN